MKLRYVFVRLYSLSTNPKGHAECVVQPLKEFGKYPQLICDPLWCFSDFKNKSFSVCEGSMHANLSIMESCIRPLFAFAHAQTEGNQIRAIDVSIRLADPTLQKVKLE